VRFAHSPRVRRSTPTLALMNLRSLLATGCIFVFAVSHAAEPCVRVRAGDREVCMKFSEKEKVIARSYGVRLGMPYAQVKRELLRTGWKVDSDWLRAQDAAGREGDLICGSGYDAVCSAAFTRGDRRAFLTLSGTNPGSPLTTIDDHE